MFTQPLLTWKPDSCPLWGRVSMHDSPSNGHTRFHTHHNLSGYLASVALAKQKSTATILSARQMSTSRTGCAIVRAGQSALAVPITTQALPALQLHACFSRSVLCLKEHDKEAVETVASWTKQAGPSKMEQMEAQLKGATEDMVNKLEKAGQEYKSAAGQTSGRAGFHDVDKDKGAMEEAKETVKEGMHTVKSKVEEMAQRTNEAGQATYNTAAETLKSTIAMGKGVLGGDNDKDKK